MLSGKCGPLGFWENFIQEITEHGYNFVPLPTKNLTPAQILGFREDAFNKYYTNPKYLKMIQAKFGTRAKKHIEGMNLIIMNQRCYK